MKSREVGKKIYGSLYIHKDYEHQLPKRAFKKAKSRIGDFNYDIVKHNTKTGAFSFIQSPDWDESHEPTVGDSLFVSTDGKVKSISQSKDPWIYHHKWKFVGDDYKGFDVEESKQRSKDWNKLDLDMSRIGKKSYWDTKVLPQLEDSNGN